MPELIEALRQFPDVALHALALVVFVSAVFVAGCWAVFRS